MPTLQQHPQPEHTSAGAAPQTGLDLVGADALTPQSEIRNPKSEIARSPRPPWYLMLPAALCGVGVLLPLAYLVVRAFDAEAEQLARTLLRWKNVELLANTLGLAAGVLVVSTLIALPAAWLTVRSDLPFKRFFTLAMVMPLAVPGYLMAYTLLAVGGNYGAVAQLTGFTGLPRLSGFWGALVALSLYNFPYMMLNLRAALSELDPGMEEVATALGHRPILVFFRVVLPHLRPALLAGSLLVGLHVLTDFGVVSLMNYSTFSYALYLQYAVYDTVYAAWIALMMLAMAAGFVMLELALLRGLRLHRAGSGMARPRRPVALRWWKLPAAGFLLGILTLAVLVPAATIAYWASRADYSFLRADLWASIGDSLTASIPAAVLATLLAMPVAYMARRYPSKRAILFERLSYLGYATPALAFALGLLVATVNLPGALYDWMYQSLPVLIYAYSLHFLAEAVGPIRASLFQATPRLEEASRSLGHGQVRTFFRVTLPLLRSGLGVSLALVFLSAMKELPLTFLLSPLGFQTLAKNIWLYTADGAYAEAAPFAGVILVLSAAFVGVLLLNERKVS